MTPALFLGIDAGGTSTRAVLVDGRGQALGYGRGGAGNPLSGGREEALSSLVAAVREALGGAASAASAVSTTTVAMAGASTQAGPEAVDGLREALASQGVHSRSVVLASDILATFAAGTPSLDGYAVVAGTGAAATRIENGAVTQVVDGMGWLAGDAGSAFWFGRAVLRAVVADLEGRGPRTAMTEPLLATLGIAALSRVPEAPDSRAPVLHRLVDLVYAERPVRVARFARLAFDAAPTDTVAGAVVARGAAALAGTVHAVIDPAVDGPVVLGGGLLLRQPSVAEAVTRAARDGGVTGPVHQVADGTTGAAVLALRGGGVEVDTDVFARITASLDALR